MVKNGVFIQGMELQFDEDGFNEVFEDFTEANHDLFKIDQEQLNPLKPQNDE